MSKVWRCWPSVSTVWGVAVTDATTGAAADKNFMVPVGGAILATLSSNDALVDAVSKLYPGTCQRMQAGLRLGMRGSEEAG